MKRGRHCSGAGAWHIWLLMAFMMRVVICGSMQTRVCHRWVRLSIVLMMWWWILTEGVVRTHEEVHAHDEVHSERGCSEMYNDQWHSCHQDIIDKAHWQQVALSCIPVALRYGNVSHEPGN